MKINLYNQEGKTEKTLALPLGLEKMSLNADLIHQVIMVESKNQRRHWAKAKDRSEVSGGGKKPWRQKGTGRARHGSTRSPIWIGGGVSFGPNQDKKLKRKINKKMRLKALSQILNKRLQDQDIVVLEKLELPEAKTKKIKQILIKLSEPEKQSLLLVVEQKEDKLKRACANIKNLKVERAIDLSALKLLHPQKIIMTQPALEILFKRLSLIK